MPQYQALSHRTIFMENIPGLLAPHFRNCRHSIFTVTRRAGIFLRKSVIPILEIRKVNINQPFQKPQAFRRFIAVGIINNGNGKPRPFCQPQRLCYLRQELHRRNQIDIMYTACLLLQKNFRQPLHRDLLPKTACADGMVLAEYAGEVTVREKDRPRAVCPTDRRLLPMVDADKGELGQKRRAAPAQLTRSAVRAAPSRAHPTV